MIRCRFRTESEDPRPVNWPIKHPYWVTGGGDNYFTVVAYADDEDEVLRNWPEAKELDSQNANDYTFTERFSKPDWFTEDPLARVRGGQG